MADRLRECGAGENVWTGRDLHREDGECYDGVGTLWACGSRLCPSCSATLRRRARARARAALATCEPYAGELWRFVTLTAPTLPGVSLLTVRGIFDRAWSLLRKREFWTSAIRAGVKGEEFTVNRDGYHYHIHILALSRWIEFARLRSEWTACLRAAWRERGLDVSIDTATGEAVVDIRLVRPRRYGSRGAVISLESALQETTKYITKSESWDKLPDAHLVEIAEVERWPRMFEVFGDARPPRQTAEDREQVVLDEFGRRERARLLEWVEGWGGSEAEKMIDPAVLAQARAERDAVTSLDTHNLSDGGNSRASPTSDVARWPRERGPTLRHLSVVLERGAWLKILAIRIADSRAYRRAMLIRKYPYASFVTLSGDAFNARVSYFG